MTTRQQQWRKGAKVAQIRAAIRKFGKDCEYPQVRDYIEATYGHTISDSTFYAERKVYRQQQESDMATPTTSTTPRPQPAAPSGNSNAEDRRDEAPAKGKEEEFEDGNMEGIIELVKAGKLLIEKLGKEDAQRLIEAL